MGLLVRMMLATGSGAAAPLVGRDAPNLPVVQRMLAVLATVLALAAIGLAGRR